MRSALSIDPDFDPPDHPHHLIHTTEVISDGTKQTANYYLRFFHFASTTALETALKAYLYAFHTEIIFVTLSMVQCGFARVAIQGILKTALARESLVMRQRRAGWMVY